MSLHKSSSTAYVAFGLTACLAAPLTGQICEAAPSLANLSTMVSGRAAVSSHVHGFGVGFSLGNPAAFVGVGIGTTHFDVLNGSSFDVDVGAGYEISLTQREGIQLCPIVSVGHSDGPNQTIYGDYSENDFAAGLRLGDAAVQSGHWRLIPTIGFGYAHTHRMFKFPSPTGSIKSQASHGFGVVTFGVGAVLNKRLALSSEAGVPIGLANSSPAYSLTLIVGFAH